MKNKLLKGAHLSERKFREIVQLFCDDLTATQIAGISGVSRVTINNYFKLIRSRIASLGSGLKSFSVNAEGILNEDADNNSAERLYYGLLFVRDKIQAHLLNATAIESLQLLSSSTPLKANGKISLPDLKSYHAIADCKSWNVYWVEEKPHGILAGAESLSQINDFWQYTKGRLSKFRGMSKKNLYLHIRECEFRYNFRNEELCPVLMNIISSTDKASSFSNTYKLTL